jgi:hypothetical protein
MLEMIEKDGGDVSKYVAKAKDKNDSFRLMGFGHRVYKNFDPRAKIIKKAADDILNALGIQDKALDIAMQLERVALEDDYFVERKLYPNVDFYSGIIYRALGIPTEMFTVMFALGRLPGWISQWKEMRLKGDPIGRPRQVYQGAQKETISIWQQIIYLYKQNPEACFGIFCFSTFKLFYFFYGCICIIVFTPWIIIIDALQVSIKYSKISPFSSSTEPKRSPLFYF